MLIKQMEGKIDSWAIRWCFHQFKFDLLTVLPSKSKVMSIGFGDSATHTKNSDRFFTVLEEGSQVEFTFDEEVKVDKQLVKEFKRKFSIISRIKNRLS
jgi:hypothetical protein